MNLPEFKYSPNAYKIGVFENIAGTCSICNERRQIKYTSSFYSVDVPEYICPWCIESGKAAEKYSGKFNDYLGIEGVSSDSNDLNYAIDEELLLEITNKTPSYVSWQQEVWLTHCDRPCAFIDYADTETIKLLSEELNDDIGTSGYDPELIRVALSKDGSLVGYLFQCVKCGHHRLHIDCD
ncbi:CbrC family protein [Fibrella aestuarina]|uniref:CbrC family protein n=1 Tax=Fibrella aestuarina TaxID=651143 RepID=UPI000A006C18|nr:CbrC family protein [Fibrella aestuarina]